MPVFLVHLLNALLFILIVIGIPSITSMHMGSFQLTSTPHAQMLTLWSLALAAAGNAAYALVTANRKNRRTCLGWALIFGCFLLVQYLVFARLLQFGWLKEFLLWLKRRA